MRSAIEGPDCIDPQICKGNCCSIKIDVPKVLAEEYISKGYASKDDFIRSDIFSFHLRFDEKIGKCFLFDKKINGCKVHNSGIKPPQCWIYPTNFLNPENINISCKRANGWKIIDSNKTLKAEKLLYKIMFLCQLEAKKELKEINKRIEKSISKIRKKNLKEMIIDTAPSSLGGFKDTWDCFGILPAEGLSLQMKKFCSMHNGECKLISENFLDCKSVCEKVADKIIEFLHENLYFFVKKNGLDTEGEYPLYKLFEFVKNRI